MRLIDADALKKEWSMGDTCAECKQDARKCQIDVDFSRMDICSMLDDAPTVAVPNTWISVKDRLPQMDGEYLVYGMSKLWKEVLPDYVPIWLCNWYLKYGGWYNLEKQTGFDYITHWMPLPEPPEVSENADGT